ncbi:MULTISPECIES: hypothetical protein [Bacillus]|uniref:DUF2116 family Zn-ribbon domain-containing protein n=2 Tax=Bacillus TaxID=1386 RepID=A0A0M4FHL1_9BACI|nr:MULTISPECIES: hypothetical protein [Bacillus]ALC82237.1 hypothetical protein AM592_12100 [Bacillus gobiensis]MBP1081086.1 putative paraquat-inducible protein A [Bacillus capparidis]MED1095775.1 hypothetical protein [Bacillus capparidis]
MEEKINCRKCNALIPYRSSVCPECGCENPLPKPEKIKDRIILIVASIVVILLIAMILGVLNAYIGIF